MQTHTEVVFDFPFPEERVFRYQAMQDILHHLVNEPVEEFTQKELAAMTGADISTVSRSVALLERLGVVTVDDDRPSRVQIDHDHLRKPDPILSIPQAEYRKPVRTFVDELRDHVDDSSELSTIVGVVLFGSVARGTADRASDIDLLVVLDGTHTYGRRVATRVARDLEERTFDGDRYEYEVLVETPKSAAQYGSKLREIFDEGVIVHRSNNLREVLTAVYEADDSEEV